MLNLVRLFFKISEKSTHLETLETNNIEILKLKGSYLFFFYFSGYKNKSININMVYLLISIAKITI